MRKQNTLELYFYKRDSEVYVSNMQPMVEADGGEMFADNPGGFAMSICTDGLAVFGLPEPDDGHIQRVRLSMVAVEHGKAKIEVDYQPVARPKARRKKRR